MPRKGHVIRRDVLADPIYNSKLITKLTNFVMLDGKKGVAQSIVYGALKQVEEKTGTPAVEVFNTATRFSSTSCTCMRILSVL